MLGLQRWTQYCRRSLKRGVEGENQLPWPAGHAYVAAAQDTISFPGSKHTFLGYVQPLIHQHSQVLLLRAALSSQMPKLYLWFGLSWPRFRPYWTSWGLHRPSSQSMSRSLWMESLLSIVPMAPHSLVSLANLLKVHLIPLSVSPSKMLNSMSPCLVGDLNQEAVNI